MAIEQDEALEQQLFAALRDHNSTLLGTLLGMLILTDEDINSPNESGQTALQDERTDKSTRASGKARLSSGQKYAAGASRVAP